MKRSFLSLALIAVLFSFSTGCKSYFTQDKRNALTYLNPTGIEKIQFYLDQDLSLVFETSTLGEEIEGGKVTFDAGKYIWTVDFYKNTPCIATILDEDRLKLFFDKNSSSYLVFGKGSNGRYCLYQNSLGSFGPNGVVYGGKFMKISKGEDVALIIEDEINENITRERTVIEGIRVE